MPIRAENRCRYPKDWAAISRRIRFGRAGGQCECDGRCGSPRCYAADGYTERCIAVHGEPHPETGSAVVLTTAHLDHTPENCADENLMALCQACHLALDTELHKANRAETRRARAGTGGQTTLAVSPE